MSNFLYGNIVLYYLSCLYNATAQIVDGNDSSINISTDNNEATDDLIDAKTLQEKLARGDVILIDVRMPYELTNGRIAQTINIPLPYIKNAFSMNWTNFKEHYHIEKPSVNNCNLVFHCQTGIRSQKAVNIVKELGYKCPKSLKGGFEAWKNLYP